MFCERAQETISNEKIREQLSSTFFSKAEADWLLENDPGLALRAADENGRTSTLFHALQKAGAGVREKEKAKERENGREENIESNTPPVETLEEMTKDEALDFLREQAVILGITNPPLKRAILMITDGQESSAVSEDEAYTVWHNVEDNDFPSDRQVVLANGKNGLWLYRYRGDGPLTGFFRLNDNIDAVGVLDEKVKTWKEM